MSLNSNKSNRIASEDHSRALRASTDRLPVDWRRPIGRPRQSWLWTIESDLKPLNLGLHSALRRATDRPSWWRIVETAMLFERATWWWWEWQPVAAAQIILLVGRWKCRTWKRKTRSWRTKLQDTKKQVQNLYGLL